MAAQLGNVTYTLGGEEHQVGLLSVADLVSLTAICPEPNGELVNVGTLHRWASHPTGCTHMLLLAGRKVNPSLTFEQVEKWGAVFTRTKAATDIFTRSVLSGEEEISDPKASGAPAPNSGATGGLTPASSPTNAPATATPGT